MERTLEPEVMASLQEARAYEKIIRIYWYWMTRPIIKNTVKMICDIAKRKHSKPVVVLDIGTGPAFVPLGLIKKRTDCVVYAIDSSYAMLQAAGENLKNANILKLHTYILP